MKHEKKPEKASLSISARVSVIKFVWRNGEESLRRSISIGIIREQFQLHKTQKKKHFKKFIYFSVEKIHTRSRFSPWVHVELESKLYLLFSVSLSFNLARACQSTPKKISSIDEDHILELRNLRINKQNKYLLQTSIKTRLIVPQITPLIEHHLLSLRQSQQQFLIYIHITCVGEPNRKSVFFCCCKTFKLQRFYRSFDGYFPHVSRSAWCDVWWLLLLSVWIFSLSGNNTILSRRLQRVWIAIKESIHLEKIMISWQHHKNTDVLHVSIAWWIVKYWAIIEHMIILIVMLKFSDFQRRLHLNRKRRVTSRALISFIFFADISSCVINRNDDDSASLISPRRWLPHTDRRR